MPNKLIQAITSRVLLGDGAMGTQLQSAGLAPGGCGEAWNTDYPERVLAIQKAYVDAGSDCLITNTFGGTRIMLDRHKLGDKTRDINIAAAKIARDAFGPKPGFVLGDIGPFGGLLEPLGDVPQNIVQDAFTEQAEALVAGGVDAIIIETQVSFEELGLAIEASKEAGATCVIGSLAYDVTLARDEIRTMMGIEPEQAAKFMRDAGVDILALNCGTGIDMHWAAQCVRRYKSVCDLPTMAQPNSGQPELRAGKIHYKQTPEQMAAELPELLAAGANIIGACCGSTPAHIVKLRPLIDAHNRKHVA